MPQVTHSVIDPVNGNPVGVKSVVVRVVAPGSGTRVYRASDGFELAETETVTLTPDGSGAYPSNWTLTLDANSTLLPAGSRYEIRQVFVGDDPRTSRAAVPIVVPAGGPFRLVDLLANPSTSIGSVVAGVVPAGEYASGTTYRLREIVTYQGSAYVARGTVAGVTPGTDTAKWQLLVAKGDAGSTGGTGPTGPTGPANSLSIGTVTTGAAGSSASATVTGTAPSQTLNLGIPTGPQGPTGSTGAKGDTGNTGPAGPPNSLAIGTVTTAAAGGSAAATVTGSAPSQTLNLTIPTGAQGPTGAGAPDATTSAKGSIQLAGDLGGTAAAPTVPGLAGKQNADSDLTTIAGLDATQSGALATDGAGWVRKTYTQLKTALGLGNVDNTSDADKLAAVAVYRPTAATQTALTAAITAAPAGSIVDLGGATYALTSTLTISKTLRLRNGSITCATDRVVTVSAPDVRFESLTITRTGPSSANSGALAWNGQRGVLIDVAATSSYGEGLRLVNGTVNGTQVIRGRYESADLTDSFAIQLVSGSTHNYDVMIDGATIRNSGYGSGVGLYNCSRSRVNRCDVRNIRKSPTVTHTGWTLVSGTSYRALDRSDVGANAVYVNGAEYTKNADPASTTPAQGFYTNPGDGYLYINTGVDPTTQTVTSARTNGYGILFYATSSEALGMSDNVASHNYVEDVDGFGIYFQTLQNVPKNNRTLQNTLRSTCLGGVTVGALPFAAIGVFGGYGVQINGDYVEGCGSPGKPAPGIEVKPSVGTPQVTGTITDVVVRGSTTHGIVVGAGQWSVKGCTVTDNAGHGIVHESIPSADTLDLTAVDVLAMRNGGNGLSVEPGAGNGEIRLCVLGGKFMNNTVRGINVSRAVDVRIVGALFSANSNINLSVANTCQRVYIDGVSLRSGVGINVAATIADLTIGTVLSDGSSGTKLNVNSQPYKRAGVFGFAGQQWVCTGTPEGAVTAPVGSMALRTDGGAATTFYIKESGTGNVGWVGK